MNLSDRVSYIRGLADGLKLDKDSTQGKLVDEFIAVMSETARRIEELQEEHDDLLDYVESIDEDLEELEFDMDDEDDDLDGFDDDEGDEDDESDFLSAVCCVCSACDELFYANIEEDSGEVFQKYVCPSCKKDVVPVPLDFEKIPVAKPCLE